MTPESQEEPEFVNGEEVAGAEEVAKTARPPSRMELVVIKPRSNIFTLLLLISLIFILVSIYLVGWELRNFYDATFGILSPKETSTSSSVSLSPEIGEKPDNYI